MPNLFTNPTFATTGPAPTNVLEWDADYYATVTLSGAELTAQGDPFGARLAGGTEISSGPMGDSLLAPLAATAGESHSFRVKLASDAPVTLTLCLGAPYNSYWGNTPPVELNTVTVTPEPGQPVTIATVEGVVPEGYAFDYTNGIAVNIYAADGSYVRITEPWIGLTADLPVFPDPEPDPDPEPEPGGLDPLAKRVAAALARKGEPATEELASEHLSIVRAFVWGYTRGRGFTEKNIMAAEAPLEAVIVAACMRLTPNPEQLETYTAGDYSERGATLKGFTLPELFVLNNYRRRTA